MSAHASGTSDTDRRSSDRRRPDAEAYTGTERRKQSRRRVDDSVERLP